MVTLGYTLIQLTNAKYFSILDAKYGYWNIELDEKLRYRITFSCM